MNQPSMQGVTAINVPAHVKHQKLINWVTEMVALTKPANVYWCDGTQGEYDRLCGQMVVAGTMKKLNEADLWPWFLFFDIWMFFFYIFTLPAIWKAPRKNWD